MAEQLYDRSSRGCAVGHLDSGLRTAILAEAEGELLGDVTATAVCCVETRSVPRRRTGVGRLLGGRPLPETLTAAVVLPRHLLVAVAVGHTGSVTAHSARLDGITVTDVDPRWAHDTGVSVFARWSHQSEAGSLHLALGGDPDGESFRESLRRAVEAAKSG
ncbi:hypothetical protein [Streptomyces sp. MI02-7b]|uniref:hypothetical protein n=1 Tax=Streptomyces sp. MI02-7b TaxID=462941 RepID=UPI0029AB3D7E|nr:hypothetical protein [Streptomyces sp. MI02-7b]MDX3075412.1 hypothetical protein [Streptomyces sp. MI02-7b]